MAKTLADAITEIELNKDQIKKCADRLREIYEELESDLDTFEEGIQHLEDAIDVLTSDYS